MDESPHVQEVAQCCAPKILEETCPEPLAEDSKQTKTEGKKWEVFCKWKKEENTKQVAGAEAAIYGEDDRGGSGGRADKENIIGSDVSALRHILDASI